MEIDYVIVQSEKRDSEIASLVQRLFANKNGIVSRRDFSDFFTKQIGYNPGILYSKVIKSKGISGKTPAEVANEFGGNAYPLISDKIYDDKTIT